MDKIPEAQAAREWAAILEAWEHGKLYPNSYEQPEEENVRMPEIFGQKILNIRK